MGREWLYLYKAKGGGGVRKPPPGKSMNRKKVKDRNTSSSGCMSVIFNLFDIQHHQFRFHHPSFMSDYQHSNLKSPESAIDVDPSLSNDKELQKLNIPKVGRIQIKTNRSRFTDELSSECSSSPGIKTPNLVARLMGLDLLPEYSSPRPSSSTTPATSHHRSRSLPSTPRLSTATRRSTDNDYHHRLSLQIDKENCNQTKTVRHRSEIPVNRQDEDLRTQYAKQITNQVRERIRRRLGTDITNTVSPMGSKDRRRDSDLVLMKQKKSPANDTPVKLKQDVSTLFSSNFNKHVSNSHLSSIKQVKSMFETHKFHKSPAMKPEKPVKDVKIIRIASERYDLRLNKMNQQEGSFVRNMKSTTLPHRVVNVKNTTKILSLKKEMTSSSLAARSSQMQVSSLPTRLNSPYKSNDTHIHKASAATTTTTTTTEHLDYISKILNQCGINSTTPISSGKWHSHSHPIHPSIFHQLENLHHPTAATAATRRMIFELVNDSLVEILKPYMNKKPWICQRVIPPDSCKMHGSDLIGKLCDMIRGFPAAHCEVLEDIDGLIERDIGWTTRWLLATAFEAEEEDVVKVIENEIVQNLVHEIATETVAPTRSKD